MCGRYNLRASAGDLEAIFGLSGLPDFPVRYNIAPTQRVLTILGAEGHRAGRTMRWGLIPHWAKDTKSGPPLINARSETVQTKPTFRQAFLKHRCLIPMTGFYEWRAEGKVKQPFHIHMRDNRPFALAGLWESWSRDSETVDSCCIVTTEANTLMSKLHDRMPVILAPANYDAWLSAPAEEVAGLMRPYAGDDLAAEPVSTVVNNARNDVAECVAPLASSDAADGHK